MNRRRDVAAAAVAPGDKDLAVLQRDVEVHADEGGLADEVGGVVEGAVAVGQADLAARRRSVPRYHLKSHRRRSSIEDPRRQWQPGDIGQ